METPAGATEKGRDGNSRLPRHENGFRKRLSRYVD
jgi:hypothetical protein